MVIFIKILSSIFFYAGIVSSKYFDSADGWNKLSPSVMFRIYKSPSASVKTIKTTIKQLALKAGIDQAVSFNESYMNLSQPSILIIAAAFAGLCTIIAASILVVYCIFYISIIISIKEYGQLRTVGMTAKQIKQLVFLEGFTLTFTAVPPGFIGGILISYALIPQGFQFSSIMWTCPLTVVFVWLTVYISIKKPADIAASVTPLEASRFETNSNGGHIHKHRKLTPAVLAAGQMLGSMKKNLLTIASLALTGILLLGLSSVPASINPRNMALSGFPRGQFYININSRALMENPLESVQKENPFTPEIYQKLRKISGFEEISQYYYLPASNDLQAQESDNAIAGYTQEDMDLLKECYTAGTIPSYDIMASKNQLVIGRSRDFADYFGVQPKLGESVRLKIFDGDSAGNQEFEIAAILDQSKIGNNGDKIDMMLLPLDSIYKLARCNTTYQYAIRVNDSYEQQAGREIQQILTTAPQLSAVTLSDAAAQNENFLQGTKLALTAAAIFIGCFGIMNLLNTILTGIIVRRDEFALMRSVGMSRKQLTSMLYCEGLLFICAGLLLSVFLGGGLGYLLCSFLKNELMSYLSYRFPFKAALIYCTVVVLCAFSITGLAVKHHNKLSLVELLKK